MARLEEPPREAVGYSSGRRVTNGQNDRFFLSVPWDDAARVDSVVMAHYWLECPEPQLLLGID